MKFFQIDLIIIYGTESKYVVQSKQTFSEMALLRWEDATRGELE
jgi:hypothetical protein